MGLGFKFTTEQIISQGRTTQENVEAIKTWNRDLDGKVIPMIPDEFIAIFLLSCSNNVDQTKKTIENYYRIKQSCPAIFDNRNMDSGEFMLTMNTTAFVPVRWPEENTNIIYVKMLDTNYRNCYMEEQLKVAVMTFDSTIWENPPDNLILVQDVQGVGLKHLTRLKIESLRKFFMYVQEGLPMKLKAVHFVNSNYVLNKFMVISKIFINPELYKKMYFHCGIDELDQFIPRKYIPSDYNGEIQSVEQLHKMDSSERLKDMTCFWEEEEAMRKQIFLNEN